MKFNYNGLIVEGFRYEIDPKPEWFKKIEHAAIKTVEGDTLLETSKGDRIIKRGDYVLHKPIADLYYATTEENFMKYAYPIYDKSIENDMKYYWGDKVELAQKAIKHTRKCGNLLKDQIKKSIDGAVIYRRRPMIDIHTDNPDTTQYHLYLHGTVESTYLFFNEVGADNFGKTAILNYASFKEPGGGFLAGSRAQEESLCHRSTLYNVLSAFKDSFYKDNHKELNYGLYTDATLYTPDIIFNRDTDYSIICDVITTAAPNLSAIKRNQNMYGKGEHITTKMINETLINRIDTILSIAYAQGVDNLVLGPFGCGVFGNDPNVVATAMKDLIENKYRGVFKHVIFSLPVISKDTTNTVAFWNTFKK